MAKEETKVEALKHASMIVGCFADDVDDYFPRYSYQRKDRIKKSLNAIAESLAIQAQSKHRVPTKLLDPQIKLTIIQQLKKTIELRLLRGDIPWSLAGTSGAQRKVNLERRDDLVRRANNALKETGYRVIMDVVDRKTNRLGLIVITPDKQQIAWEW